MTKRALVVALALVVSVLLVGCSRTPPPPTAGGDHDDRSGAPIVTTPRDVRPYADDPCRGPLSDDSLRALGFSPPGDLRTLVTGDRSCEWTGTDEEQAVGLIVLPAREALVDAYRVRQFAVFRPAMIAGLPATSEQSSPSDVSCTITVGTARGQGFIVDYSDYRLGPDGRPGDDPCSTGSRFAERVAATLPPLSE